VRCAASACLALCVTSAAQAGVVLERFAEGFERPVHLTHAGERRVFVVEQPGTIRVLGEDGRTASQAFLDIRHRVRDSGNEQGLLSVAFHPRFAQNGRFFVNYTDRRGASVVAEFSAGARRALADPNSERRLLSVDQPYSNHNGGQLAFGPDGFLYIGMGDGGAGGDPLNAGQDTSTLLGAMLRIDVDGARPYTIPASNPFVKGGGRPEIWAIGLRNPWRFSFDPVTGDLYIADVGQNAFEEIHVHPANARPGANFGWRVLEASACYSAFTCSREGLQVPQAEYEHDEGCSVTGGHVYRGKRWPALAGKYLFGDFCTGTIWTLERQAGRWRREVAVRSNLQISSFGEDAHGELYVLDLGGSVYRIEWR
jgi:glucose/arabinose dehydrogenase